MQLWPIHPKPHPDELLSSWVTRIAMANQMSPSDFCKLLLPGKRITLNEIDRAYHPKLIQALATGTGVPIERVLETSLLSDEGYIFLYRQYGTTEWVLPTVNVDGHVSKGLAYCPLCLKTDTTPYYRKSWRYAFNPVCPVHRVFLRQGCPKCGKPHNYFEVSGQLVGSPVKTCMHCDADISNTEGNSDHPELIEATMLIQEKLNRGIAMNSFDVLGYESVRTLPFLRVLHALICTLGTPAKANWVIRNYHELPNGISACMLERSSYNLLLEQRDMGEMAMLLCLATTLIAEWPSRLLHFIGQNEITVPRLFSNRRIPFWVTETISEHCFAKGAAFSKVEIKSARQVLRTKLGRKETPSELKSFMSDGMARYLSKVSKEKQQDIELSPIYFKLEAPEQGKIRRLRKHQIQARKLINASIEQITKIAIFRQPKQSESNAPIQPDLFVKISSDTQS